MQTGPPIGIPQSIGKRDDERYIVFVRIHYKHVGTHGKYVCLYNCVPSGAQPSTGAVLAIRSLFYTSLCQQVHPFSQSLTTTWVFFMHISNKAFCMGKGGRYL